MVDRKEIEFSVVPDKYHLDEEWVNQPKYRFQFGAELADASRDMLEAKSYLEVVYADVSKEIRDNPELHGVKKVTEDAIKNAVISDVRYKEAKKKLIDCQHTVDILEAAVSAVDHKKKALEDLVQLHLSSYYSNPRASGEAREVMTEVEKRSIRGRGRRDD